MASLNATDANMPVALESFDDCANNSNEENPRMAIDDTEKDCAEKDENRIDVLDNNSNDYNASHKTMEHVKELITNDETSSERSQPESVSNKNHIFFSTQLHVITIVVYFLKFLQPKQYNDRIPDNANANPSQTNPIVENSPNDPLHEHDDNIIDRVNENDVNELDKIFCDKSANPTTSDNDDSRSIPGIDDSDIGDDITNDNRKDSNSLQTINSTNVNASLDSNVFSDVEHRQHQEVHALLFFQFFYCTAIVFQTYYLN